MLPALLCLLPPQLLLLRAAGLPVSAALLYCEMLLPQWEPLQAPTAATLTGFLCMAHAIFRDTHV